MQFLVYLTVLMVSISTVLLEVHWLTSPAPQPRPAMQATNVPTQPRKVEGPNVALSPVYPKPADTQSAGPTDATQSQPQQAPASSNAVPDSAAAAANTGRPKPAAETTGVAARADESKDTAAVPAAFASATTSNNRCDVQACSSAYQSFRAADCTYQPFEGPRRICEKSPMQRTARDQSERPERRQWNRDQGSVAPRDSEGTVGRRLYDDPDESDVDEDDYSDHFSVFRARGPRW